MAVRGEKMRLHLPVMYSERADGYSANAIAVWFLIRFREIGIEGASSHSGRRTFDRVQPCRISAPNTRWTLARPIPNRRAILTGRTPSAFSALTSLALARAVGFLPRYRPSAFAFAIPSRCRSSINSRSNAPTAPMMVKISLPVAVPVSALGDERPDLSGHSKRASRRFDLGDIRRDVTDCGDPVEAARQAQGHRPAEAAQAAGDDRRSLFHAVLRVRRSHKTIWGRADQAARLGAARRGSTVIHKPSRGRRLVHAVGSTLRPGAGRKRICRASTAIAIVNCSIAIEAPTQTCGPIANGR
jgi:hypothetical protein